VTDTALVQDKNNKNILTVYRGDVLERPISCDQHLRKRVGAGTDTSLKIKHISR
jgi:hypothetical protein